MVVQVKSHIRANLSKRIDEARAAARFAKIISRDNKGRARVVNVPGHDTKYYQVILKRVGNAMQAECLRDIGALGTQLCPASKFVCYHILASVIALGKDANREISICSDWDDAIKLSNFGGVPFQVVNKARTDSISVVAR